MAHAAPSERVCLCVGSVSKLAWTLKLSHSVFINSPFAIILNMFRLHSTSKRGALPQLI